MLDLIIQGGQVVTPEEVAPKDIAVQGGKIVAVASPGTLEVEAGRTIDAQGKLVVPGGIEPHAHIASPIQPRWTPVEGATTQSPDAASRAAAFGGTTTVVDFAPSAPSNSIMKGLEERQAQFSGHFYVDFAFHSVLSGEVTPEIIGEIGEAAQSGVATFKIFTTFAARVPDGHLWAVMEQVAQHGGMMAIHAEDDEIVNYMTEKLKREGRDQGYNIHLVHNNLSEDISFRKVIRLAKHTGVGVYFVHTTAKEGVAAIAEARGQGQPVYGEALHHYLEFTCEDYKKPGGTAIHTYPAIKFADDRDALFQGLVNGTMSTTATDEYTTSKQIKLWGQTVETVCGGHAGIETRVPVAFTKGVSQGHMSLQRFVEVTSTNAAKILGMYPQKGAIAPGSDADIVLIDPNLRKRLTLDDLHADTDYSIWEGFECQGYPVMTISRGQVVVENGKLVGGPGHGQWLRRKVSPEVRTRPVC